MTRGRRDGILKAEKQKHVVKIGPMHLKGVWIPFEKALEFANKEKITEMLYPLFVHNIGALLYHPVNHGGGGGHAGRFPMGGGAGFGEGNVNEQLSRQMSGGGEMGGMVGGERVIGEERGPYEHEQFAQR